MPSPRTNRELLYIHSCGPRGSQLALELEPAAGTERAGTERGLGVEATPAEILAHLAVLEAQLRRFRHRLEQQRRPR
jgi:hypothetical protein